MFFYHPEFRPIVYSEYFEKFPFTYVYFSVREEFVVSLLSVKLKGTQKLFFCSRCDSLELCLYQAIAPTKSFNTFLLCVHKGCDHQSCGEI